MSRDLDWNNFDIGDQNAETSQGYFNEVHTEHERGPRQRQLFQNKPEMRPIDMRRPEMKVLKLKSPKVTQTGMINEETVESKNMAPVNEIDEAKKPMKLAKFKPKDGNPYSIKIVSNHSQSKKNLKSKDTAQRSSKSTEPKSPKKSTFIPRSIQARNPQSPSPEGRVQKKQLRDGPTVTGVANQRPSRLTKYAEIYAAKRKALAEKIKKENDAKMKSMRTFRARSVPKYIKARKIELEKKKSPKPCHEDEVTVDAEKLQKPQHRRRSKSLTVITRSLHKQKALESSVEEEPDEENV